MRTSEKINNPAAEKLKVLIAPLDWGLGHATRCIPIIKELLNLKCIVVIAASGPQKTLLQGEFPTLTFVEIPGYRIKYGKNRAFTILRFIASIPKILIRIKQEKQWLLRFAVNERPDLVISDNRFGLHLPGTISIFMTHQLAIQTPFGAVANSLLLRMNYFAMRDFTMCWVPDRKGNDSLAGKLSHPRRMPAIPVRYIGWLSRFGAVEEAHMSSKEIENSGATCDLLILLSGPEPQRTIFENMILGQVASCECRVVLVRGLPGSVDSSGDAGARERASMGSITIYDHLPAAELEQIIRGCGLVISRSGYSTVMDLMRLGKKAVFIPTPGQTEQEYLAAYLAKKGCSIQLRQKGFSLKEALSRGRNLPDSLMHAQSGTDSGLLTNELKAVLALVQEGKF